MNIWNTRHWRPFFIKSTPDLISSMFCFQTCNTERENRKKLWCGKWLGWEWDCHGTLPRWDEDLWGHKFWQVTAQCAAWHLKCAWQLRGEFRHMPGTDRQPTPYTLTHKQRLTHKKICWSLIQSVTFLSTSQLKVVYGHTKCWFNISQVYGKSGQEGSVK